MSKHSQRTLKNHQQVYELYDRLKGELLPELREHTKTSYYVDKIMLETDYSESCVKQILSNRYKKQH